ncbi:MAG: Rpn family recombination-promoting nuclease/putative transposase [Planctomycetota bacterium]|jgi:hypothetical protein|nr:Rpn family recombination-promoting nuclease/putative transposase [Planctomycetota bacterium]
MSGTPIYQPHDHLARSFFAHPDIFRSLVEFYLPAKVADNIDLESFQPEEINIINDNLKEIRGDICYSGKFINNTPIFIYLECQSTVDNIMILRFLQYIISKSLNYMRNKNQGKRLPILPIPIAITLYHGKARWKAIPQVSTLCSEFPPALAIDLLDFHNFLIDLSCIPVKVGQGHPFLQALLILLRASSDAEPMDNESLTQVGKIMASAKTDSRIKSFTAQTGIYILEVIKVAGGPGALEELFFIPILGQEEGKKMSATTIDDIKAQCRKEARAIEKLENTKNHILVFLKFRFGEPPIHVQEKILHCQDLDFVGIMMEEALNAKTLDEFRRHLNLE